LNTVFTNEIDHLIYKQDATGSDPQLISMLVRNLYIARRTNVVHSILPHDLYTEMLESFKNRIVKQSKTITQFCEEVLDYPLHCVKGG